MEMGNPETNGRRIWGGDREMDRMVILAALYDWKHMMEMLSTQGFDNNIVEDRCLKAIKELEKREDDSK